MPRITIKQRSSFISALQAAKAGATETDIAEAEVFEDLLKWLYSGKINAGRNEESALSILQEFVAAPGRHNEAYTCVHENNDTYVACDGYKAAVILSDKRAEWDMLHAFITNVDGTPKSVVQDAFDNCRNHAKGETCADNLRKLLKACSESQDNLGRKLAEQRISRTKAGPADIYIDPAQMEQLLPEQAIAMYTDGVGCPMRFDAAFLHTVLRFMLCSGTDSLEYYYSHPLAPMFFHAGKLYAILYPLRIKAERKKE